MAGGDEVGGKAREGAGPDRAVGGAAREGRGSAARSLRFCSAGGEATGAASAAAVEATPGAMSYIPGQPVTAVVVSRPPPPTHSSDYKAHPPRLPPRRG